MRRPNLAPLVVATFISDFGSSLTLSAIPVLFLRLGHPEGAGIYNGWSAFGAAIGCLITIGFIDRFRKNRVAVIADIARGLLMIPLILDPRPSLWFLVGYAVIQGLFGTTTSGAVQSWIAEHDLTPHELKNANSKTELASQLGNGAGPFIGLLISFSLGLSTVFLIDCLTYFVGAALVFGLTSKKPTPKNQNALREIKEGFAYVAVKPEIQKWITVSLFHCVGFAAANTVYLTILGTRLAASESQIFMFQSSYFVGAILGGVANIRSRFTIDWMFKWGSVVLAAVLVLNIAAPNYTVFFGLAVFQSFARIFTVVATRTKVATLADDSFLGRVMVFRLGMLNLVTALSYVLIVPLMTQFGTNPVLAIGALFFFASVLPVSSAVEVKARVG